ncbi:putative WRKY transcription factor 26 [Nymphaea thermarum]|nr:putative WRKY transcription factor 26 [Nymphaea thermarum]
MKFCTELPAYLPENFPAADNGSSFQLPGILDFSDPLIDDESFEGLERDGNLQFPALDSSQPNKLGDSQANKQTGGHGSRKRKSDVLGLKVAFKTMSDVEVLDDGYRWRKYGKKKVKDNQNPRNYYRCSHGGGCSVKKRVERDRDDPRFVVTTYEGTHNHECPYIGESSSRKRKSDEVGVKIAFKTMSDVENLDDGYRWRKYGKKMVKDNQNPRNYYRCSHGGCSVKKRAERDSKDPRFVITTYEGTHNHECPYVIYYITPQHDCDVGVISAAQIPFVSHGLPYAGRQGFYLSNYIES